MTSPGGESPAPRVLHVLTYFAPHVSGLTVHVERLTRHQARHGLPVTVLASRHDPALPLEEERDGVRVVRVPVLAALGKGVLMPRFLRTLRVLIDGADVVHLHLPLLEAGPAASLARKVGRPCVVTVYCDLVPPPGLVNALGAPVVRRSMRAAARSASVVSSLTEDYVRATPFFAPFAGRVRAIPPAVEMRRAPRSEALSFRRRLGIPDGAPVVGLAARWAADKGIGVLLAALDLLRGRSETRDVVLVCAGPREETRGETVVARLAREVERRGRAVVVTGLLPEAEMPAFYGSLDVLALPSVNRTEAFGIVQVEAMLCGVPVVASDLPGVRTVVGGTGAGLLVPPGDPARLAEALAEVLARPELYRPDPEKVAARYDPSAVAAAWEETYRPFTSA